ncbi:MAG: AMP-binding protein [Gammaproteobacteria bacterium]|nr:AMP-binding protein [Gammaproteobacteria bacterium]
MNPQAFTVYDMLAGHAASRAAEVALVTETGEARSFAQMRDRVDALAGGLVAAGLRQGDRLLVLAQNSAAFFELYFACARQGVVLYPLNWRLSADEVARSLERADARGIVIDSDYLQVLPESLPDYVLKTCFDAAPAGWVGFDTLYDAAAAREPAVLSADDDFAIISTAAVDVIPRGAILTHHNVLFSNLQTMTALGLGPGDGNLLALPLFHIAALGGALAVMHAGGQNVVMRSFDAARAVELIQSHALTFMSDFPPVLNNVLDAAQPGQLDSLRIVSGLDAPATIERLHSETNADFWTGFGQTETTGWVSMQRCRDLMGAAGVPCSVCSVKLVDDYDQPVPTGTPGEILVRGPIVFKGYFAQPDVTEHTFRGGWHHTGDVGRFDENGVLYYVKRKPEKELIKPGGENVYPAEVETVIMELEAVGAVCVFGVADQTWGEAIKAVVQSSDPTLKAEQVIEHVASRIARFKRPKHVVFVDSLPTDDTGAVDREAVKSRWGD